MNNKIDLYLFENENNEQIITVEEAMSVITENTDLSQREASEVVLEAKNIDYPILVDFSEEENRSSIKISFYEESYLH